MSIISLCEIDLARPKINTKAGGFTIEVYLLFNK
jgi:hypothetical protein